MSEDIYEYINLCFMITIHEDKIINKYFDLGRGHFGYSHVTGVTEAIKLDTIS